MGTTGSVDTTGTTGEACFVPKRPGFELTRTDGEGAEIEPECGVEIVLTGTVLRSPGAEQIAIATCGDTTCDCGTDPPTMTIHVDGLPIEIADVVAVGDGCANLLIARTAAADGCSLSVFGIEVLDNTTAPRFIASNEPNPAAFSNLPPIELAEPTETCVDPACTQPEPGKYALFVGDVGPIPADSTTTLELDPFGSGSDVYDFTTAFAYVDETCVEHAAWVALASG